jgi:hypothetical protein
MAGIYLIYNPRETMPYIRYTYANANTFGYKYLYGYYYETHPHNPMTTDELIQYYVNLLIIQYHEQPKAQGHINALATETIAGQLINQVWKAFDIETAVGAQLDIIGKYVGIARTVNGFIFGRDYFAAPSYDDAAPAGYEGFIEYSDSTPAWYFAVYADTGNQYNMTDDEMRIIIKMKIVMNAMDTSLANIDTYIDEFFSVLGTPVVAVTDNLDMTINYDFNGGVEIIHRLAVQLNLLPAPAGVQPITTGL